MRRLASLRCTTFPHGQSPRTFTSRLLKFSEFALKFPLAKETDAPRADFLVSGGDSNP